MSRGAVLITGGCGFVGYHIVEAFLMDKSWPEVHVMSRNPTRNLLDGVRYHAVDTTAPGSVYDLLRKIKPEIIVHAASPLAVGEEISPTRYFDVNVKGTKNLLECAAASGCVRGFIYTSSTVVMAGSSLHQVREDAPLIVQSTRTGADYAKSKALADQIVLDYNGRSNMKTLCLRIAPTYGVRDTQILPQMLNLLKRGQHKFQIGRISYDYDFVSANDAAMAHLLAAKALLRPEDRDKLGIGGEAFFVTEGDPLSYWDFQRKVFAAAGDRTLQADITITPPWLMLAFASMLEWMYLVFTLGQKTPPLRRHAIEYVCSERTHSIDKAKVRLGYLPTPQKRDERIQEGVKWIMDAASRRR
ncbi:MAG: hypothetical protein M1820_010685 [Bogoriella megaspora]|nr:MAG: hypothetical protein M1820_010685 [Bogoriella megaspora]